jgi:Family of unknown function (DUF5367)
MRAMLLWGLAIWLLATLALRGAGQWLFGGVGAMTLLFALSVPAMVALPRWLLVRVGLPAESAATAAIALVMPGMLLDTLSTLAFPWVFPNMPQQRAAVFAAWILFCNAIALASMFTLRGTSRPRPEAGRSALN